MSATVVIPEADRIALRAMAKKHGHRKAASMLDISFDTLVRALAECGVQRGTAALIRTKLADSTVVS